MRDVLRTALGRSLRTLSDEDRLMAAWAVACGPALAARAQVLHLDEERVLHIRVLQSGWRDQFAQMRTTLTDELRRIAGVRLQRIHFEGQGSSRDRVQNARATSAATKPAAVARRRER